MSTASISVPLARPERRPNRLAERAFFAGMAVLILATVLFGFAKTYFLAGMVAAPLPNKSASTSLFQLGGQGQHQFQCRKRHV